MWPRVVEAYGSLSKVGDAFGITRQSVFYRQNSGKPIPAEWCEQIERETGISRSELRPDLWPG